MCLVSLNENQWEQLCVFMNFPYWNETVNHSLKVFFCIGSFEFWVWSVNSKAACLSVFMGNYKHSWEAFDEIQQFLWIYEELSALARNPLFPVNNVILKINIHWFETLKTLFFLFNRR